MGKANEIPMKAPITQAPIYCILIKQNPMKTPQMMDNNTFSQVPQVSSEITKSVDNSFKVLSRRLVMVKIK